MALDKVTEIWVVLVLVDTRQWRDSAPVSAVTGTEHYTHFVLSSGSAMLFSRPPPELAGKKVKVDMRC